MEGQHEAQKPIKHKQDGVAKGEDISRIAETLSTQIGLENNEKDSDKLPALSSPVVIVVDGNGVTNEEPQRSHDVQRQSSSSSLSDSGRFSASKRDDRASSNHSSDEELEWDEEYEFGNGMKPGKKVRAKDEDLVVSNVIEKSLLRDSTKKTKRAPKKGIEKAVVVTKEESSYQNVTSKPHGTKVGTGRVKNSRDIEKVKPRSQVQDVSNNEKGQNNSNMEGSVSRKKSSSGKSKKSIKRTRYKIYLDDPDVHQTIAEFSGLLRKLKEEVERGELVPKPGNRLHPQSRDDVYEGLCFLLQ